MSQPLSEHEKTASDAGRTSLGTYDYIIVGAGSAGCVLANRLSADGKTTVALLEAGGRDWNPWIHIPVGYFKTIHNPNTDWCYSTEPDPGIAGRSIKWPRGKVLGGSSSINGLLYVRGQRQDYDRWASLGCQGWAYDDVLPYFKRAENQSRGESEYHGEGGPLHVSDMTFKRPICDDFIKGVAQLGTPQSDDINGWDQEGVGYYQLTAHKGRRCSSAVAYLKPARPRNNLSIITKAHVERVGFDGHRATDIFLRQNGMRRRITARAEIILSAGAIGSPQLLQLSGIGPGAHLQSLGIPTLHDSSQVGENLQDHLQIRSVYKTKKPVTLNDELSTMPQKARAALTYAANRSGPLSMAASQVFAFCRTRYTNDSAITASVCQLRPESRGNVMVRTPDANDHPLIKPNYLSTDLDCQVAVESLRYTRRIMQTEAMREHIASEHVPNPSAVDDGELLAEAREIANTIYHPTSTCRMGGDNDAVLAPDLTVNGVTGLRVVDASVMPEIVSGNTNAPTIMIAEKAADMILATR